jgi:hypothetical protein
MDDPTAEPLASARARRTKAVFSSFLATTTTFAYFYVDSNSTLVPYIAESMQ